MRGVGVKHCNIRLADEIAKPIHCELEPNNVYEDLTGHAYA